MTMDNWILAAIGTATAVGLWRSIVVERAVQTLAGRLARHTEALALLTDTSEAGFASIARELDRVGSPAAGRRAPARRRPPAAKTKRRKPRAPATAPAGSGTGLRLGIASREEQDDAALRA